VSGLLFERMRSLTTRYRKIIGFLLVGGLNTVFGFSIYPALLFSFPLLQKHYLWALVIAQIVSVAFAYVMYKRAVFRTSGPWWRELWTFCSFYLIVFMINLAVLPFLVEIVGLPPIVAQLAFGIVTLIGSYIWHSRLTFRLR